MKCPICQSTKLKLIWNDKIRSGKNSWTSKKHKISHCQKCDTIFLNRRNADLLNNKVFRKKYDGSNSILRYKSFNKPREKNKLDRIRKYVNFTNKLILESNCGAGTNLDYLKIKAKLTAGLDSEIYKNHVKKKHLFFSSLKELKNSKVKFDIILSLAEIEHQYDVYGFVKSLKDKLQENGLLIFRIPNYNNIYMHVLGKKYLKYDFRTSHNFYFSEKSSDFLFKRLKLKVFKKFGLQEYSINHLIEYIKIGKRVSKFKKVINKKISNEIMINIEKSLVATSFIYIVRK